MEDWGHVTTVREVIRGEDSPVKRCNTRAGETGEKKKDQKQVSNSQFPHGEGQSRSKDDVLWKQERRHERGKRL